MLELPSHKEGKEYQIPIKKPSAKNDSSGIFNTLINPTQSSSHHVKRRDPQKNKDTLSSLLRNSSEQIRNVPSYDSNIDLCPTAFNGPVFIHATKKHIEEPKPKEEKQHRRKIVTPIWARGQSIDFETAGKITSKEKPLFSKKIVHNPTQTTIEQDQQALRSGKARVNPIMDPDIAGASSKHINSKPERKKILIENREAKEYEIRDTKKRIPSPKYVGVSKAEPIRGGGFIPENAKPTIKVSVDAKPKDNKEVLTYAFCKFYFSIFDQWLLLIMTLL
ncbi:hypothetical protein C9374_006708 [Naegleria lovaniensis]|uniref:Uncharacterized protein n=1 Tax=Naegleria lovaniensis TaxID=51637 RepID=A0AA88GM00_NAELO|nr:uncharacterized protein C9374_006708 [Naegleria lovaniensis]KAG2379591.1 hypothetical protein C9374_006708 [Naegleria lovaniensis]